MKNIKEFTLEELVKKAIEMKSAVEDIEAGLKVTKDEIGDRLKALKLDGTKVDNYYVSRVRKLLFTDITLSYARELGATITKESLDNEKLRAIYMKGIKIKGAKWIYYISIKEEKE